MSQSSTYLSAATAATKSDAPAVDSTGLPRSVRGAPLELRRLIRKKQNADSARRCRLKLRLERQREAERSQPAQLPDRIQQLTKIVTDLQARLVAAELSCAALLEHALAAPAAPMFLVPSPVSATKQETVPVPHLQLPTVTPELPVPQTLDFDLGLSPSNTAKTPYFTQEDSLSDNECNQPPSPTNITAPNFFDVPVHPFKQQLDLLADDSRQNFQFESAIDQMTLL